MNWHQTLSQTLDADGADLLFSILREKSHLRLDDGPSLSPPKIGLQALSRQVRDEAIRTLARVRQTAGEANRENWREIVGGLVIETVGGLVGLVAPSLEVNLARAKSPLDHIVLPAVGWIVIDLSLEWWAQVLSLAADRATSPAEKRGFLRASQLMRISSKGVQRGRTLRLQWIKLLPSALRPLTTIPRLPLSEGAYRTAEQFFATLAASSKRS